MPANPSQARDYMVEYYPTPPATEKANLEYEWQALQMADGELPMGFLTRAKFIRTKCEEFDVVLSDSEANRHVGRCLSSEYEHERRALSAQREISTEDMRHYQENAYAESQLSRQRGQRTLNHALSAITTNGRGDHGSPARRQNGGGGDDPHNSQQQNKHHNPSQFRPNSTH
ncbi:unnamed protein product, partial [Sphacelaria rigidula]